MISIFIYCPITSSLGLFLLSFSRLIVTTLEIICMNEVYLNELVQLDILNFHVYTGIWPQNMHQVEN